VLQTKKKKNSESKEKLDDWELEFDSLRGQKTCRFFTAFTLTLVPLASSSLVVDILSLGAYDPICHSSVAEVNLLDCIKSRTTICLG
jgi:hypothetical protein